MKKNLNSYINKFQPFIVSEIGINHFGSLKIAKKIVDQIYNSGGRIVKSQLHILDEEMSKEAKKIKPGNANTSIYNVIKKNHLNVEDEKKLKKYVESKNMLYICTPFSLRAAKILNKIGIKIFKIGSGEFNNLPLINEICKFKLPIILSTGMNELKSIKKTVSFLKKKKADFALLHCISEYPAKYENLKLDYITTLKKKFPNVLIGYSDHSDSIIPCLSAYSKGAQIIEKHFTHSKKISGPDIKCSMDAKELSNLVTDLKIIDRSNGFYKKISTLEKITAKFAFASVVSIKDIKKDEKLSKKNIWVKRPGTGNFLANEYFRLIGKKSKKKIKNGTQIKFTDIL